MSEISNENLQSDINQALEKLKPALTRLSAEDYKWALGILRDTILPYRFELYAAQEQKKRASLIEGSIDGLNQKLERLPPSDKKKQILAMKYQSILGAIDKKAYDLAVMRHRKTISTKEIRQATELKNKLMDISQELKKTDKALHEEYSELISESLLDLKYAIEGKEIVSLRLNRLIESSKKKAQ
jgi:hypothetical protein